MSMVDWEREKRGEKRTRGERTNEFMGYSVDDTVMSIY